MQRQQIIPAIYLSKLSEENAKVIAEYIFSIKFEANSMSDHYRINLIRFLTRFSNYFNNKSFWEINREDILSFLGDQLEPEEKDPMHKSIGTYNLLRTYLLGFFKWLYYPQKNRSERPRPEVMENIAKLKRRETSTYKPTDLWTPEEDLLFLKYCPSKRMKAYHSAALDADWRPSEGLRVKVSDIKWKIDEDTKKQYAELILFSGKSKSRSVPLINSIPYVKDYLDHEHPMSSNLNAPFICGLGKRIGRRILPSHIRYIYSQYKTVFFPKLLESPNVLPEDKPKIRELLTKPWNPYIRRHTGLTQKGPKIPGHLNQHAGWVEGSTMGQKYLHYFGSASSESLLEAYGIINKNKEMSQVLKPRECPNCNEPNRPDSRFCAKCRMVLTYDAYNETLEKQQEKESEVKVLRDRYEQDMKTMREEMENKFQQILTRIDTGKLG